MKTKKLQLISLAAVCAVSVGGAIFSAANSFSASAALTSTVTTPFTSSGATMSTGGTYLQFEFKGDDADSDYVKYRNPLAYKWFWNKDKALEGWDDTDKDSFKDVYQDGYNYFSTQFAFTGDMNFKTFTVTFNSSENSKTKDDLTTNEIVFFNDDGVYSVAARTNDDKDVENKDLKKEALTSSLAPTKNDDEETPVVITITFTKEDSLKSGEYAVHLFIGDETQEAASFTFTNIAGSYVDYDASNGTLAFSAEVDSDTSKTQKVNLMSLNGQSFKIDGSATITDFAPTVIAVNDEIKTFTLGTTLKSFDYLPISVCNSSSSNSKISKTLTYYQYDPDDIEADWATLTDTIRLWELPNSTTYATDGCEYVAIKIVVSVSGEDEEYTYYLSDYAEDGYSKEITLKDPKSVDSESTEEAEMLNFLKVGHDTDAPYYIDEPDYTDNVAEYQQEIDDHSDEVKAGDGYYFYLPSLENLIDDDETSYTGLKFTIYYRSTANSSTSTQTSLAYNKLQIPTTDVGDYEFRVIAADKNGNTMKLCLKKADGSYGKEQTVTSSNIWDFDEEVIPTFKFTVQNQGMEIEEIETLTSAYINANYTIEEMEVNGNERDRSYDLYHLEGIDFNDISYSDMIAFVNSLVDDDDDTATKEVVTEKEFVEKLIVWYKENRSGEITYDETEQYLTKIPHWDSDGPLSDDDDDWETHGNYNEWKDSSLSFTPRESGYYILRVKLADSERLGETKYAYQVVQVQAESDAAYGETYWIENNVVTVVFIVIAAVCAVGIVVLLLVKPSEETVEADVKKDKSGTAKKGKFSERRKKDK
jgi:hypothetical protein